MAVQSQALNQSAAPESIETSAFYGTPGGAAASTWYHNVAVPDGASVTHGLTADAAVTDPTSSGSIVAILKGILTFLRVSAAGLGKAEDAVAASGDTGVMALGIRRDSPTSDGAAGDYHALHVDALGRLRTIGKADEDASNARTTALAASLVVKASAGKLFGFSGYSTTAGFVLVHNTTSVPADGQVPAEVLVVEANKPFSFDAGRKGIAFGTGITIVFSSTGPTKTIGGSVMWVSAQYE